MRPSGFSHTCGICSVLAQLPTLTSDRDSFDDVSSDGLVTAVVESGCSGIGVADQVLDVFQWDALTQQISYRRNTK
jgi:hypothetical protein